VGQIATENEESHAAWNGVLYDRFLKFQEIVTTGLGAHGEAALAIHPPPEGARVLDIGCAFGDTTRRLAGLVGPQGSALGIDIAARFIEDAEAEAGKAGIANAEFAVGDVQATSFDRTFDYAFSRMGTMFFASPLVALRNVREALVPGGRLVMVVWRRKLDNDWLHRAELVVEDYLEEPEESDEPTCGPGPFSMAGADTTSDILTGAGFEQISLQRCDIEIKIGDDLDEAVDFTMSLGPAGEVIRLVGDKADEVRPQIEAGLRKALAEYEGPEGVIAPASTWIVSATALAEQPA